MYNSGARVSEITSLKREQVAFGATTFLELHGKGRKERTILCGHKRVMSSRGGFES